MLLQRQKYQGNRERVSAKSHEVHHQGEKRIFHFCLAVLFLPEAVKIRPGVFRAASFTGDHLYLVSICKDIEKNTGFINVMLGPGSRHLNSWDSYKTLLACSFLTWQWHAVSCLSLNTAQRSTKAIASLLPDKIYLVPFITVKA